MAVRNILHKSKLEDFKNWLIKEGWKIEEPIGEYEVFRARTNKRIIIFYDKLYSKEHYTVPANCTDIVRKYLNSKKNCKDTDQSSPSSNVKTIK